MNTELNPIEPHELLTVVRSMLLQPLDESTIPDGSVRIISGDPGEVVADIGPTAVVISEYALLKAGSAPPALQPILLGSIDWRILPDWTTRHILGELIAAATGLRRSKYVQCTRCGRTRPPEAMASITTCCACDAQDEGVVY
ncbi:hypothetical protein [Planctomicrobium piriforme]|uniref:Uncharacterized protein n=1 Tax=Planctomicrobium piriforme TaxID=1576369 RepID=A0A1I3QRH4_9PLAN|nr:hypothetical protein [Planctomicrobium piriforme]SFJ36032.1 hypothetical protein SAMN05421753_1193 [Planctomicrobium piriforme]